MIKKEVFLLIVVLFSTLTYAEISGEIKLGETKHYVTANESIIIYFEKIDLLKERAGFMINDRRFQLLPLQKKEINNLEFNYISSNGNSLEDFSASFVIDGNAAFECPLECEENKFINFVRIFDSNFSLCKRNCSAGCGLYKEKRCIDNELWLVDNCNNQVELLEKCSRGCISSSCTYCGDRKCSLPENYFNCRDCKDKPDFCINNIDCEQNNKCVNGKCSGRNYVIGDEICSLPEEKCSSRDCSCDNRDIKSKGKDNYPLILFHGFASSPLKLRKLQRRLSHDLKYENGGEISLFDRGCPSINKSIIYRATYYSKKPGTQEEETMRQLIQKAYLKVIQPQEDKRDTFIETFSMVIDKVKSCSDSNKVNIIAHSMGGLVTRTYLLEGDNIKNVNKIILLGSPNHGGIYGAQTYRLVKGLEAPLGDRRELLRDCIGIGLPSLVLSFIDGRDVLIHGCRQMQEAGSISNPILDIDETPGLAEYYTITGKIDDIGDGVVPIESVALQGAVFNKVVECNHFDLKHPGKCKDAYFNIVEALGYDPANIETATPGEQLKELFLSIGDFFAEMFE